MKFIIVEGANGVGKSTFVNKLKDRLPNCGILKLTGLPGDSHSTYIKTRAYHNAVLNYLLAIKDLPGYMILDRCYLSEVVMATLYKDWTFRDEAKYYNDFLRISDLDVMFLFVGCESTTFVNRLKRNKVEFNDISYSVDKSTKQQDLYLKLYKELPYDIEAYWLWNDSDITDILYGALKLLGVHNING